MAGKLTALLLALMLALLPAAGEASLAWKQRTPAQQRLKTYIEQVDVFLDEAGEWPINSLFEIYDSFAVLGITREDNAEMPEDVEITARLLYETINTVELRVSDPERFPEIAAAFLRALYPDTMTREEALLVPAQKAQRVLKNPEDSFADEMDDLAGERPRVFYAYFPNEYRDGVGWMQMTIVFPLRPEWEGGVQNGSMENGDAYYEDDVTEGYEGYFSDDDFTHLEIFATPTPEPDSAAADEMNKP